MELFNKIQISKNRIGSIEPIFKFGKNDAVGTSFEELWTKGGAYSYIITAGTIKISSDNDQDKGGDIGLQAVQISGLDGNYARIKETVILAGQTPVNTVNSYLRVFTLMGLTAGSNRTHLGKIYAGVGTVTLGVPDTVLAQIDVNNGESQGISHMAIYTIPAGKVGLLTKVNVFANRGDIAQVALKVIPQGFIPQYLSPTLLYRNVYDREFDYYYEIPEKTDIALVGRTTIETMNIAGGFDLLLVSKNL